MHVAARRHAHQPFLGIDDPERRRNRRRRDQRGAGAERPPNGRGDIDQPLGRHPATSTLAQTSNRIANANLFGGMIKAGAVHVVASAARNSAGVLTGKATATAERTDRQREEPSRALHPPTRRSRSANLGTLWVHRVINTPSGVTVHGLDLILSVTKNGFKKGTEFIIGAANAAASSS